MGASAVLTPIVHITDMKKAFTEIRNEAIRNYGNGGYTGSIAEKSEVFPASLNALTEDDAVQLANRLLFDGEDPLFDDKYGPAGAIPIKASSSRHRIGWMFFGWCAE